MGRILTFYSYKGGTGRSMAVANLAWILASNGKSVLMVDWDLEAPGLHRYFAPFLVDKELQFSKGVIDAVVEFSTRALTPLPQEPSREPWYSELADVENYVTAIDWPWFEERDGKRGRLDLFPSGQQGPGYATRVNSFNWDNFYERLGGGVFLEAMKGSMASSYDYTLIDSRTGVSDTSGICTVQLPDAVVVCFALNNQGIEGAAGAAQAIAKHHTDSNGRQRVPVYPVPMRVDPFESDRVELRRAYARRRFQPLIRFLGERAEGYWEAVEVPYRSLYAYEEVLASFGDRTGDPKAMLASFERLAEVITGGDVTRMPPIPEEERLRIRAAFAALPDSGVEPPGSETPKVAANPTAPAVDVYLSYPAEAGRAVDAVQQRLRAWNIQWTSTSESEVNWIETVRSRLTRCPAYLLFVTAAGLNRWQKRETALAWEYQRQKTGKPFEIIPVLLAGADGRAVARDFPLCLAVDLNQSGGGGVYETLVRRLRNPTDLPEGVCPYVGSDPYPEGAENVFFGREKLAEEIAMFLSEARLVVLHGPAGVGKTSLVQAGVIPRLRRMEKPRWEIAAMTPGFDPFGNLVQALQSTPAGQIQDNATLLGNAQLAQGLVQGSVRIDSILEQVFKAMPNSDRLLLVLDQFGDLLRYASQADQLLFVSSLSLAAVRFPVTLLAIVREDEVAPSTELWKRSLPSFVKSLDVPPLEARDIATTVDKLAPLGGLTFAPDAESRLVELAKSDLAVLSIVLKNSFGQSGTDPVWVADVERAAGEAALRFQQQQAGFMKAPDSPEPAVLKATATYTEIPSRPSLEVRTRRRRRWVTATSSVFVLLLVAAMTVMWPVRESPSPAGVAGSPAFGSGLRALAGKRYNEAVKFLTLSINDGGSGLAERAYAYRELSEYDKAREDLGLLVSDDPQNAQHFRDRAYVNRLLGRYEEASSDYGVALQLEPDSRTYRDRAYLFTLQRKNDQALEDLSLALSFKGDDAEALTSRAVLYSRLGRNDEALKDLEQAVKVDPASKSAQALLQQLRKRTPQKARVFLHVPAEAEIANAFRVRETLERQDVLVEPPEVVGSRAPAANELRYFRTADAREAEALARAFTKVGFKTTAQLVAVPGGNAPPPRQFEWWMGSQGAATTK